MEIAKGLKANKFLSSLEYVPMPRSILINYRANNYISVCVWCGVQQFKWQSSVCLGRVSYMPSHQ
jgi:hypothetical protein